MENKVRDVVRVTGEIQRLEDYKKSGGKSRGRKNPVKTIQVDARVWKTAMRLANNDSTRIEVINSVEVRVVNQSKKH